MSGTVTFRPDDFDAINATYFAAMRASGRVAADPSGWLDTFTDAADLLPPVDMQPAAFGRYYLDEGSALSGLKEPIVQLISAWEARSVALDEVTITHSVSATTLLLLVALQRNGVKTVVFETPGYAVTMNQAESLGMRVVMLPTRKSEGFRANFTRELIAQQSPCAIWLTQPRMSLGFDQTPADIAEMLGMLSDRDYLVIDEATERRFPSQLRELGSHERLVRMRGLLKGVGLNGLRVSFALHHRSLRGPLEDAQEVAGGSLDLFSLQTAATLGRDIPRFRLMLDAASDQIARLRRRAEMLVAGSPVELSPLVNGYIGCMFLKMRPESYEEDRRRMLEYFRDRGTPVLLGASMRFAFDPTMEAIRLNYFNRDHHVLDGIQTAIDVASTIAQ